MFSEKKLSHEKKQVRLKSCLEKIGPVKKTCPNFLRAGSICVTGTHVVLAENRLGNARIGLVKRPFAKKTIALGLFFAEMRACETVCAKTTVSQKICFIVIREIAHKSSECQSLAGRTICARAVRSMRQITCEKRQLSK